MPKPKPRVALIMGSDSDFPKLEGAVQVFEEFSVGCEVRVMSAHRSPEAVARFARSAERRGVKVLIAAAGGAAHLAGVAAAHTILPVIGVPIGGTALSGLDSLLSTVQMPSGVPVASMAVGASGGTNAALFALQILARSDKRLATRLRRYKSGLARRVDRKDAALQKRLNEG
jgi:5-(carboxyamino)imidazole ribonucleotide mutase